mmetsp:Transcript_14997/g.42689  ORF Transcript_14997/g.42689 Transcript_14997/m.42689 type:complete len:227 (+) Transcript_14997:1324-2004(+)
MGGGGWGRVGARQLGPGVLAHQEKPEAVQLVDQGRDAVQPHAGLFAGPQSVRGPIGGQAAADGVPQLAPGGFQQLHGLARGDGPRVRGRRLPHHQHRGVLLRHGGGPGRELRQARGRGVPGAGGHGRRSGRVQRGHHAGLVQAGPGGGDQDRQGGARAADATELGRPRGGRGPERLRQPAERPPRRLHPAAWGAAEPEQLPILQRQVRQLVRASVLRGPAAHQAAE